MNPFEMVVAIVVAVMVARVVRDRYRTQAMVQERRPDADVARMAEEITRLRERVQVLERVVTDGHGIADLSARIEQLRDR